MTKNNQKGQALIMLLFFVLIGTIITTAAIFIIIQNSLSAGRAEMGVITRQMADTGVENALLQVLRGNCASENFTLPDGDVAVDISLSGVDCSTITKITSTARASNYIKVVEVNVSYVNNVLTVGGWKEVN